MLSCPSCENEMTQPGPSAHVCHGCGYTETR